MLDFDINYCFIAKFSLIADDILCRIGRMRRRKFPLDRLFRNLEIS